MAGNCELPCFGCKCTCSQSGTHPKCMNCWNCQSDDDHDRK